MAEEKTSPPQDPYERALRFQGALTSCETPLCLHFLLEEDEHVFEADAVNDLRIVKALAQTLLTHGHEPGAAADLVLELYPAFSKSVVLEEIEKLRKKPVSVCKLVEGTRAAGGCEKELCEWQRLECERLSSSTKDNSPGGQEEPRSQGHQDQEGSSTTKRGRVCIELCGDLLQNIEEVLQSLYEYNNIPAIYQRGGRLCRVRQIAEDRFRIEELSDFALRNEMSRAAVFQRVKPKEGGWVAVDCEPPILLVRGVLALERWDFPYLNGLVNAPVIRPDGSVLLDPGYDASTGLYYTPEAGLKIPMPESPTKEDAKVAAKCIMDEVLHDFPFVDEASKAGALAAFLTPIVRPMIDGCVPLALVDKPSPGTGASKLLDLVSIVATGRPMAAVSPPAEEEEWRKQITSWMREGAALICIDNIASDLKADALSRALSSSFWKDRTLGKPDSGEYPQRASWYATGNNLTLSGDLPRRSHLIQLDAKMPHPWERTTFKHFNINRWVAENRGLLITALLTMARAWVVAGRPGGCKKIIGGFDEWVTVVGGILAHAGISGFLGNLPKLYEEVDQGSDEWADFLQVWQKWHKDKGLTSLEVLDDIRNPYTILGKCVPSDLAEKIKFQGPGDAKKVGLALRKKLNVRYKNGLMLSQIEDKHEKAKLWRVVEVEDHALL